ncbi:MAG: PIN domain-containing protein [Deltaproteobacteria bacterium]|nr:PIN domain-containing protein [Deltaproteobacteria bacterium]
MSTFDLKIAAGAKGCLVDTSIWVEVLRSRDRRIDHPVISVITEFTETDFIYTSRLIVAELIAGARHPREAEGLEQDFEGYRFPGEDLGLFREAAYTRQAYGRAFRRRPAPGLIDCYLACLADHWGLIVFTADKPLRSVSEFLGIKGLFFSIEGRTLSYIE